MKIQIASDLHTEFMGKHDWEDLLQDEFPGNADTLILAGDICSLKFVDQVRNTLGAFCERYKNVIYVKGNHEYYGITPTDAHHVLGAVQNELYNLYVLQNHSIILDGQQFYGGTLWFPDNIRNKYNKQYLNDFNLIKNFEPWVYEQAENFITMGRGQIDKNTIVVSHHLPSYLSVDPRYAGSALNNFFVNDVEYLFTSHRPKLWVHGHTHIACDYTQIDTRVICNPRGYPHERNEELPKVYYETGSIISPEKVV